MHHLMDSQYIEQPKKMTKKIFIMSAMPTLSTELVGIANALAHRTDSNITFLASYLENGTDLGLLATLAEKITLLDKEGKPFPPSALSTPQLPFSSNISNKKRPSLWRRLRSIPPFRFCKGVLETILTTKKRILFYRQIIQRISPNLVVIGADIPGTDSQVLVRTAQKHGIRTLVIPSTMSNGLEQAEVYFYDDQRDATKGLNWLVSKIFPKWARCHKGKKILYLEGYRIVALEFLGYSPQLPWLFNSDKDITVIAESEAMIEYYAKAGLSREAYHCTGIPSDDLLAEVWLNRDTCRTRLNADMNLCEHSRLLVVALPPDTHYMLKGKQTEFATYEDLVNFWITALSEVGTYNIVLCLHPSTPKEQIAPYLKPSVKLAAQPLSHLVPLADLYVACVSTTLRWAISCGIPAINYDAYDLRYDDFANIKGIVSVNCRADFTATLQNLTQSPSALENLQRHQKQAAPFWGRLDGHSTERILTVIDNMATPGAST